MLDQYSQLEYYLYSLGNMDKFEKHVINIQNIKDFELEDNRFYMESDLEQLLSHVYDDYDLDEVLQFLTLNKMDLLFDGTFFYLRMCVGVEKI